MGAVPYEGELPARLEQLTGVPLSGCPLGDSPNGYHWRRRRSSSTVAAS